MDLPIAESTDDPHSSAKSDLARVEDIYLELNVDFDRKVLEGKAILTIERKPLINAIILDQLGLDFIRVTDIDGRILDYHVLLGPGLRSPLYIKLRQTIDTTYNSGCRIQIEYKTRPGSPALYWLTPEQTADGEHPFLLSNNQLIYARAWFPCQDTPSVKFTYTAKISVPKNFRVLMSAVLRRESESPELKIYEFRQKIPVPSYAVIIAVGALEKRKLDAKSNIFAERKFIDESFDMFRLRVINKIRRMLEIAESVCGPYVWDRYDICVLPPSIAHFEIECPCVTFISPTLFYGDFSCISFFARNISQSWAGNLVTCVNNGNLWLNKSFSIFISRKIICKLLFHNEMKFYLRKKGLHELRYLLQKSKNAPWPKCLIADLTSFLKPHIAASFVPYERGCMLLYHLEDILGGSSVFEPFLKSYFDEFALRSINTQDWQNYLYQYFTYKQQILANVTWDVCFYDAIPPLNVPGMTAWETECFELAEEWVKWDCQSHIPSILMDANLCDAEKRMFLNYLTKFFHTCLTTEKLMLILRQFNYIFEIHNSEIRFYWLLLCIKVRWAEKVESALKFAVEYCSPTIACPIFQHLYEWEEMRPTAIETYVSNKEKMLYETRKEIVKILHLNL